MTPPAPLQLPAADEALAWTEARTAEGLARAREVVEALKAADGLTATEALRRMDEVTLALSNVGALASLISNVHPDEAVRTANETAEVEVDKLVTELRQDRALYDVFAGVDASGLDATAARLLDKVLEDFRRAGVDKDDATRARLAEINERLVALDQEFSRNIRDDVRYVKVAPERLVGMPQDWLDEHPVDEEGLVSISTDYPDTVPARMFVQDAEVRAELAQAFLGQGWPQNDALLKEMFDLRHELAGLVGYDDWASYDAAVKMIGSGPAIPEFIDKIAAAAEEPMQRDLALLLARAPAGRPGRDVPRRRQLVLLRRAGPQGAARRRLAEGAHVLPVRGGAPGPARHHRPAVRRDATSRCPTRRRGTRTSRSTTCTATDEQIGRIYLDLFPREGKFKHAAQFTIANGVGGRQLPEGALVCNFNRGLMEHDHVVTLFHEFGHLVHHVLGGHVEWTRFSGVATEWDFVEAPSQMLEEWAWDADILQTFAKDEHGEPIPADLVARMRAADDFGKGVQARQQMFYASMSYWFHTERPEDLTAKCIELQDRYSPYALPRRHPHVRQLRPPRRLLLGVLHLCLVAGDRQGPVLRLRPRRPVQRRRRRPLPRPDPRPRRHLRRRRPGRRLPRPPVHLRLVRRLAGAVAAAASP